MSGKISVIGAGNGGVALAADLAMKGFDVCLYAHPDHDKNLRKIKENGGVSLHGVLSGKVKINTLTTSPEVAVKNVKYIFVALPAYAQEEVCDLICPFLERKAVIIFMPGNFFSLCFMKKYKRDDIILIETSSLPYACRATENGGVDILGIKKCMNFSVSKSTTAERTEILIFLNTAISTKLKLLSHALASGFECLNAIMHPAPVLLNTGWVETTKGDFFFYKDGVSPSIGKFLDQLDMERLRIAESFGIALKPFVHVIREFYDYQFDDIGSFARCSSIIQNSVKASPSDLNSRFITEDIPYILVPWHCLAKMNKVEDKGISCLISLASLLTGKDYLKEGRNLESMGVLNEISQ